MPVECCPGRKSCFRRSNRVFDSLLVRCNQPCNKELAIAASTIWVVLAAAGGLAVFAAQLGMGESWRIGVNDEERTELVTGGWQDFVIWLQTTVGVGEVGI